MINDNNNNNNDNNPRLPTQSRRSRAPNFSCGDEAHSTQARLQPLRCSCPCRRRTKLCGRHKLLDDAYFCEGLRARFLLQ